MENEFEASVEVVEDIHTKLFNVAKQEDMLGMISIYIVNGEREIKMTSVGSEEVCKFLTDTFTVARPQE